MFNLHKTRIKTALSRKDMQCCFKHIESSLRYHPNGTRFFFFAKQNGGTRSKNCHSVCT